MLGSATLVNYARSTHLCSSLDKCFLVWTGGIVHNVAERVRLRDDRVADGQQHQEIFYQCRRALALQSYVAISYNSMLFN